MVDVPNVPGSYATKRRNTINGKTVNPGFNSNGVNAYATSLWANQIIRQQRRLELWKLGLSW
ncbi:hypothetical protein Vi05172_g10954 [Venturia inaequalis]|nr:hypothetical protein Vi05172_g10954 [Venturia inaequalis]